VLAACGAAAVSAADEFYDPNSTNNYAEASVMADPAPSSTNTTSNSTGPVPTNITCNTINGNSVNGTYGVGNSTSNAIIVNSGQSQNSNTNRNRLSNSNINIQISASSAVRIHKYHRI
jgi:hypothetical protein